MIVFSGSSLLDSHDKLEINQLGKDKPLQVTVNEVCGNEKT